MTPARPNLKVDIGGLRMKNPIMAASGCFGYGYEYAEIIDVSRLGAIVTKGTSLRPRRGNPVPRIAHTPAGMLNAIGLQNDGLDSLISEKLPRMRELGTRIVVNIFGETPQEYAELAGRLDGTPGIDALELNISCPNTEAGGMVFGNDPSGTGEVVAAVRDRTHLPLIVKLSPNVTDITATARAAVDAGADALSLVNTLVGMAIDVRTRRPLLANMTGGLSGPAIKPVAVRMVWEVAQAMRPGAPSPIRRVPIIGVGGIMCAADIAEFMIAGASAVAVGTANFASPRATVRMIDGLEAYLVEQGMSDVSELVGSLTQ